MTGVVHFLDPYRYRSTFHRMAPDISEEEFARDYVNHLEEIILYEGPDSIAAILMESVTGNERAYSSAEWISAGCACPVRQIWHCNDRG